MCNACGNFCCGSDMFSACGCEHCPNTECWPDEDDEDYEDYECEDPVQGFICLPCADQN